MQRAPMLQRRCGIGDLRHGALGLVLDKHPVAPGAMTGLSMLPSILAEGVYHCG